MDVWFIFGYIYFNRCCVKVLLSVWMFFLKQSSRYPTSDKGGTGYTLIYIAG